MSGSLCQGQFTSGLLAWPLSPGTAPMPEAGPVYTTEEQVAVVNVCTDIQNTARELVAAARSALIDSDDNGLGLPVHMDSEL